MPRLTVLQARAQVARQLQLLDVEGSPELVETITGALATAQRTLAVLEPWLVPIRRSGLPAVAGRAWYPLPCAREGVQAVGWQSDPAQPPRYLQSGLAMDDLGAPAAAPLRCGIRATEAVASVEVIDGGTGYVHGQAVTFAAPGGDGWAATGTAIVDAGVITGVTITDAGGGYTLPPTVTVDGGSDAVLAAALEDRDTLLLAPTPIDEGSLVFEWRQIPPMFLTDTDRLIMDDLAVILTAAAAVGPGSGSPRAAAVSADAGAYIQGLRRRSQPAAGATFGFGSTRRR